MKLWLIEPGRWKGVGRWITTSAKGTPHFELIASLAESVARYLAYNEDNHRELFAARCCEGDAKLVVEQHRDGTIGIRVAAGRGGVSSAAFRVLCEAATRAREETRDISDDIPHEPNADLNGEVSS